MSGWPINALEMPGILASILAAALLTLTLPGCAHGSKAVEQERILTALREYDQEAIYEFTQRYLRGAKTIRKSWLTDFTRQHIYILVEPRGPSESVTHLGVEAISDYYRDGQLLTTARAAGTGETRHHFHLNHLGTPLLITEPDGSSESLHSYFPFGEELTPEMDTERMKFTGHERDLNRAGQSDDLDYMHARYCSPLLGRFLSPDPMGAERNRPQGWNRYAYALNNPLKWVDPTGETVSLADLSEEERGQLLEKLNEFTGNTYGVNESLELVLLEVGASSSETATSFLNDAIAERVFTVESTSGRNLGRPGEPVRINFATFSETKYGKVDPATFNLGSTFVHECARAVPFYDGH